MQDLHQKWEAIQFLCITIVIIQWIKFVTITTMIVGDEFTWSRGQSVWIDTSASNE